MTRPSLIILLLLGIILGAFAAAWAAPVVWVESVEVDQ